jgi:predicted PurR-regulated permease PerM
MNSQRTKNRSIQRMLDAGPGQVSPARPPRGEPDPSEAVATSPRWGVFTKFLVALVAVAVAGTLLVRFQQLIAPLVLAIVVAYLLRPIVAAVVAHTRLSWGAAAALVYAVLLILLITLLTIAGLAILQQMQGLYAAVLNIVFHLPEQVQRVLTARVSIGPLTFDLSKPLEIGSFRVDLSRADWQPIYNQALGAIEPALSRTGAIISSLATGTAETLGWSLFVLFASFYLLFDWRRIGPSIGRRVPAGYAYDARRLVGALAPIWNAFLRGQVTLAIVMGIANGLAMTALGVRYAVVLGLMGGLLEFIPIVGPFLLGVTAVAVALFQPGNWLGLGPVPYALVVLAAAILLQQLENNFLVPRILGGNLHLNPVLILVGAIVAADLAGIVGLMLSAPTLATLRLFGRYVYRKLFDLDPWDDPRSPA